ncbi:hypothetical protein [Tropicimonas sp. IMCC34011]|uniref:hypothetical protein n=1 Tax=Tropicimonas sp. IMCC34011 TaxID=2248759 RepID=UPI001300AA13|nr:hypothetical protein [Tropicimonas sp. IMCC34011]
MKVAICFFGITRSLARTIGSIEQNILEPARAVGEVRTFAHFFRQVEINNPRSGEKGQLPQNEHTLLAADSLELEEPDVVIDPALFLRIKKFGDEYIDEFRSIRNLLHQLYSLKQVSSAALSWGADIYVFARPDIIYHDSFDRVLYKATNAPDNTIFIPNWANWGPGYNDRFCVCVGERAVRAYTERILQVERFCADKGKLHAEKLVKYAVDRSGARVKHFTVRGSRVRSTGEVVNENFQDFRFVRLKQKLTAPNRFLSRCSNRFRGGH